MLADDLLCYTSSSTGIVTMLRHKDGALCSVLDKSQTYSLTNASTAFVITDENYAYALADLFTTENLRLLYETGASSDFGTFCTYARRKFLQALEDEGFSNVFKHRSRIVASQTPELYAVEDDLRIEAVITQEGRRRTPLWALSLAGAVLFKGEAWPKGRIGILCQRCCQVLNARLALRLALEVAERLVQLKREREVPDVVLSLPGAPSLRPQKKRKAAASLDVLATTSSLVAGGMRPLVGCDYENARRLATCCRHVPFDLSFDDDDYLFLDLRHVVSKTGEIAIFIEDLFRLMVQLAPDKTARLADLATKRRFGAVSKEQLATEAEQVCGDQLFHRAVFLLKLATHLKIAVCLDECAPGDQICVLATARSRVWKFNVQLDEHDVKFSLLTRFKAIPAGVAASIDFVRAYGCGNGRCFQSYAVRHLSCYERQGVC